MEIGCNTSPEYRRRYCIVNNFDGLAIDQIVSIFSHRGIVSVPFPEIDVNVAIKHFVCCIYVLVWVRVRVRVRVDVHCG